MAFNIRAAIIAGLAVLATAGYCSWHFSRTSQSHLNDQKSMAVTQQLGVSRAQVEQYVDRTATELTTLIEKEMSAAPSAAMATSPAEGSIGSIGGNAPPAVPAPAPSSGFTQSDFVALAVLGAAENSPWAAEWFQTKNAAFTQAFMDSQLAYLPLARVKGDQVQFARIEGPDKRIYFVLSVQIRFKSPAGEEIKIATGILPATYFGPAVESSKGSGDEVFLTDFGGFAYTYPDQQYVGAKMDVHPIVKRAIRGDVSSDVREGKNLSGQLVAGGFEKLRNCNLIMIMTSPILARSSAMMGSIFQVALVSFALVLLTAGLIALMGRREKLQKDLLVGRLRLLETRSQTPAEVKSFGGDQKSKEALRDFANGIVQYLRGPLAAVLGQAQLAISKSSEEEVKTWLTRIEKEARLSRDFVEGIAKSQGLTEVETQKVELESVVTQSLQDLRSVFTKNEIHLEENYKSRARAEISAGEFRQILRHIFQFQVQRLGAISSYRKISIDLEQAGPFLRFRVSDSAPAPESDVLRRFFEPFQVEGLQFSLAKNVVEKFRGTLSVEKSETGGLEFRFDLPALENPAEKVAEAPAPVVPPATPMASPAIAPLPVAPVVPAAALKLEPAKASTKASAPPIPELKIAPSKPMAEVTNSKFILNGQAPLEKMELKDLPPAPAPKPAHDAEIKSQIVAEELSVVIRKPKTTDEGEA